MIRIDLTDGHTIITDIRDLTESVLHGRLMLTEISELGNIEPLQTLTEMITEVLAIADCEVTKLRIHNRQLCSHISKCEPVRRCYHDNLRTQETSQERHTGKPGEA